jgi:hypothetical protein
MERRQKSTPNRDNSVLPPLPPPCRSFQQFPMHVHDLVVDSLFFGFELGKGGFLLCRKDLGLPFRPRRRGLASTCSRYAASRPIRTARGTARSFDMAVSTR